MNWTMVGFRVLKLLCVVASLQIAILPAFINAECRNFFLSSSMGNVSLAEVTSGISLREWYTTFGLLSRGYVQNSLVELKASHPCRGFLASWHIYLRARSKDPGTFWQVILQNEFDFLRSLFPARPPEVILDLGGNCGLVTLYMATLFPSASLVMVEPSVSNFLTARVNTIHLPNVRHEHAGIWDTTGTKRIASTAMDGTSVLENKAKYGSHDAFKLERISSVDGQRPGIVVPTVTIPNLIEKYKLHEISFMKIDVEGAEELLFSPNHSSWLPWVVCMSMEVHTKSLPDQWLERNLLPTLNLYGLRHLLSSGELSVWCHPQRHRKYLMKDR